MNRRNIWIVVFLGVMAGFFWKLTQGAEDVSRAVKDATAAVVKGPELVSWEDDHGNPTMIPESELPEESREERKRRKEISESYAAQWKTPITFYGKVVDEKGAGVENAEIKIIVSDTSREGTTHYQLKSDSKGLFTLANVRGKGLSVYIEHPGYLTSKQSRRNFEYAGGSNPFVPNPQNPEVFRLQRKGETVPLVQLQDVRVKVSPNGKPTLIDLYTGKSTSALDSESLQIRAWIEIDESDRHRPFSWKVEFSSPGGGVLQTEDEFVLTSPEAGFQESITIDMSRPESADWRRQMQVRLILLTQKNNCAVVEISIIPSQNYVRLTSKLNPDGGRSLYAEPGYKIQVRTHLDGSISLIRGGALKRSQRDR